MVNWVVNFLFANGESDDWLIQFKYVWSYNDNSTINESTIITTTTTTIGTDDVIRKKYGLDS